MEIVKFENQKDTFPVMLFSPQGRLISANLTAQPLLHHWNCRVGRPPHPEDSVIEERLMGVITCMQNTTVEIPFNGLRLRFDVVPFAEAGYTGLYGFHVETVLPEHILQKIRLKC